MRALQYIKKRFESVGEKVETHKKRKVETFETLERAPTTKVEVYTALTGGGGKRERARMLLNIVRKRFSSQRRNSVDGGSADGRSQGDAGYQMGYSLAYADPGPVVPMGPYTQQQQYAPRPSSEHSLQEHRGSFWNEEPLVFFPNAQQSEENNADLKRPLPPLPADVGPVTELARSETPASQSTQPMSQPALQQTALAAVDATTTGTPIPTFSVPRKPLPSTAERAPPDESMIMATGPEMPEKLPYREARLEERIGSSTSTAPASAPGSPSISALDAVDAVDAVYATAPRGLGDAMNDLAANLSALATLEAEQDEPDLHNKPHITPLLAQDVGVGGLDIEAAARQSDAAPQLTAGAIARRRKQVQFAVGAKLNDGPMAPIGDRKQAANRARFNALIHPLPPPAATTIADAAGASATSAPTANDGHTASLTAETIPADVLEMRLQAKLRLLGATVAARPFSVDYTTLLEDFDSVAAQSVRIADKVQDNEGKQVELARHRKVLVSMQWASETIKTSKNSALVKLSTAALLAARGRIDRAQALYSLVLTEAGRELADISPSDARHLKRLRAAFTGRAASRFTELFDDTPFPRTANAAGAKERDLATLVTPPHTPSIDVRPGMNIRDEFHAMRPALKEHDLFERLDGELIAGDVQQRIKRHQRLATEEGSPKPAGPALAAALQGSGEQDLASDAAEFELDGPDAAATTLRTAPSIGATALETDMARTKAASDRAVATSDRKIHRSDPRAAIPAHDEWKIDILRKLNELEADKNIEGAKVLVGNVINNLHEFGAAEVVPALLENLKNRQDKYLLQLSV